MRYNRAMFKLPSRHLCWFSVLLALFSLTLLAGCGLALDRLPLLATPTLPPTATLPPSPTPLPKGGNLTIRLAEDVPNLRPWQPRSRGEEQMIGLLYRGLMRLDAKLQPQPDLARRWDTTPDGRILTFTLRSGLTWHDGKPLTSADVYFTLNRLRSLPFSSTALLADLRYIAGISAPNPTTIAFSLTERYAPLLAELTLPILPRHRLEERDLRTFNFWDAPIGSGPFRFTSRVPGQSVVFSRFDKYHRGASLLEKVIFFQVNDEELLHDTLKDGRLLLAELPWNTSQVISETLKALRLASYPENSAYFLAFNLRTGRPFADLLGRKALAQALDIPRLVQVVTKGQGIPLGSSAAPGSWADLTPPPTHTTNLEAAGALLNTAGWPLPPGATIRQREGKPFSAKLFVRQDDERRMAAAKQIAEAAGSIGLQITIEAVDFNTGILPKYAPPYDFDLLLGNWQNGAGDPNFADYLYYDPDDFLLFHSSQINQGVLDTRNTRNFVAFNDSEYDKNSLSARQFYEIAQRSHAYQKTQARIADLLPYLYLWTDRIPVALNKRVTTLDGAVDLSTPNYFWNIERWYLADQ